ncbi:serpentine type 7TM GPCR chemoreceptor srh domain-containing protein [Ditylenchus destructor]|uniref:Serpentine type 7TM GPCR chemoreceptor srh domain-containing protein n=1 Tax=Ditylenchus destructor TaxID=166010 RepID=A0AAD4MZZ2_9BILA|nr:serpentine type 7TM GPCR chemoreceptor srh domain-containing protein [Ditylenchus destructor]
MEDQLYSVTLLTITIVSILLQCYVFFMIIRQSPTSMSSYRYFLCLISAWDLLFTILLGLGLHPKLMFPISAGKVNGFFKPLGLPGAKIGLCLVVYSSVNVIASQAYCLIYRLTVVIPNKWIHEYSMKPISKVIMQIIWQALALAYGVNIYWILLSGEQLKNHIDGSCAYFNITPPTPGTPILAMNFDPDVKVNSPIGYGKAIVIGFVAAEFLCFLMAYFIVRVLRKNARNFSKKTYLIQLQLTFLLIAQLASPIVFFLVPVVYALYAALAGNSLSLSTGDIGIIFLTLYALSNSLLTILFVTPYRRYTLRRLGPILGLFGRRFRQSIIQEASSAAKPTSDRAHPFVVRRSTAISTVMAGVSENREQFEMRRTISR